MKSITLELVLHSLLRSGLITDAIKEEILQRYPSQQNLLSQNRPHIKTTTFAYEITPIEVIASLKFALPQNPNKTLTEELITEAVANELGIPFLKIDPLKLDPEVVTRYIPRPYALRHLIIPVAYSAGVLTIAVANPFDTEAIENIKRTKAVDTSIVLSPKSEILNTIREFFGFRTSISAAASGYTEQIDITNLEQLVRLRGQAEIDSSDKHIVNAVDYLLRYAFEQRASDIHIEPKRQNTLVRFRIDGVLHLIHTIPKVVHAPIVSRIKTLARMDIAEKRRPQDGRIKANHKGKEIELRVSTLPVAFAEKVVIRIFDPDILLQDLDSLGFYEQQLRMYQGFISKPNGIIFITGPTGSGKTTTLYSTLKTLSCPELNITTIEDPIEMVVEDFNQVAVQPHLNINFSNILRTILRQDPDIIMVGEIRDTETAEHAVQSALTGHLVLSTLHTNDAPSSIIRLIDLGIAPFLISSTVIGIVAQRLVRVICKNCKRAYTLSKQQAEVLQINWSNQTVYYGEGCSECRGTGYRGRTAVFEVMQMTDTIKALLSTKIDLQDIYQAAYKDHLQTLKETAIAKMLDGITTYEEVISITG